MPSSHHSQTVPARIEEGQIIDVNIEAWSVSAVTQFTRKPMSDLAFAVPYTHYANGEGIYFMPEVGSLCWICFPSDGSRPFILAFTPARDADDQLRANRAQLNPGDIFLGTRDENFVILRRGGIVQIGGGALCQRMFIPVNNVIKDFCENYSLQTLGGALEWTVDREEETTDGKRPALLRIKAKEYADDQDHVAILEIGSHSDSAQNILSLVIKESGADGAATKISLEFRKDGSASWSFESGVEWKVKGDFSLKVEKDFKVVSGAAGKVQAKTMEIEATGGSASIKSTTTIDILAGTQVNVGPRMVVGGSSGKVSPVLMAETTFMTWLLTHKHPLIIPSGITGPPEPPPGTDHISKTMFGK